MLDSENIHLRFPFYLCHVGYFRFSFSFLHCSICLQTLKIFIMLFLQWKDTIYFLRKNMFFLTDTERGYPCQNLTGNWRNCILQLYQTLTPLAFNILVSRPLLMATSAVGAIQQLVERQVQCNVWAFSHLMIDYKAQKLAT